MRGLPFFKPKNKPQFAGLNFSDASSSGGGGGAGGGIDESMSYDEVEVGTAPDGAKLYKKTVHIQGLETSNSLHKFAHNISNISKVWRYYGFYYREGTKQMQGKNTEAEAIIILVDDTYIYYYASYFEVPADVTIYYTKTTD